ncbi:MAG: helix-turn-helix transcriptional regulator, partial [Proteobacteria bacterium]|nr:helix-turn-helix transcriptional regulator [Pseudomonadota bacterium]
MAKEKVDRNKELRNNRKSEILSAAKALFIEHGWEKTTIRQIVTSANTSIGNFYFYFSNKRALMEDLIDELLDDIRFD